MQQVASITAEEVIANQRDVYETETGNAVISINDSQEYIQLRMVGRVEVEEYKQLMERLLETAKSTPYCNLIYDLKELTNTDPRARAWYVGNFLPRAIRELDREMRVAMVQPSNLFQRMAAETVSKATMLLKVRAQTKYVTTKQKAIDWLFN